jgi:hypothetical protein
LPNTKCSAEYQHKCCCGGFDHRFHKVVPSLGKQQECRTVRWSTAEAGCTRAQPMLARVGAIMTQATQVAAGRFRARAITALTSSSRPTTSRPGFPSSADRTPRRSVRLANPWNGQPGAHLRWRGEMDVAHGFGGRRAPADCQCVHGTSTHRHASHTTHMRHGRRSPSVSWTNELTCARPVANRARARFLL